MRKGVLLLDRAAEGVLHSRFTLRRDEQNPQKSAQSKYLRYLHAGFEFFAALILLTWGGIWLDGKLGTGVLFTLLGLALGFTAGFYSLYSELYGASRRGPDRPAAPADRAPEGEEDEESGGGADTTSPDGRPESDRR